MINCLPEGAIHVRDLSLWAHVGVLEKERILGQKFLLNFSLWLDLDQASKYDDISTSVDYSLAIRRLQKLSLEINCLTIEHFSEKILDLIESLYGPLPMKVLLTKCAPPVEGFDGDVQVERSRYFPLS